MQEDRSPAAVVSSMRRGLLWFVMGGGILILVHVFRESTSSPLLRYGPFVVMFAGAYLLVMGLEKMVGAYTVIRKLRDPQMPGRFGGLRLAVPIVVALMLGLGWSAYAWKAPYWDAIARVNAGDAATETLQEIGERHVTRLNATGGGLEALAVWKDSAEEGLALKTTFDEALAGARHLADTQTGIMKKRADIDVAFYTLCMEWMDLYASVQRAFGEESMIEPPLAWAETYDDIVDRIQALEPPPKP